MWKNIYFIFLWIFYLLAIFINNISSNFNTSLLVLLFLVVLFLLLYLKIRNFFLILLLSLLSFTLWLQISNLNKIEINENIAFIEKFNWKEKFKIEISNLSKISEKDRTYIWKLLAVNELNIKKNVLAEIVLQGNDEIKKWDILEFESKIYKYEEFNGFNYEKYMLSKNIYFKSIPYNYEIIWKKEQNIIIE